MWARQIELLFLAAAFVLLSSAGAQGPPPADPDLPRLYHVTPDLATAAQPSSEGLAKLQLRGYKAVINLRLEEEGALEERLVVEKLGMQFLHVPIRQIDVPSLERFSKALREAPRPLLIHGDSGNRVGALWMIYRVQGGASLSDARSEAEAIGLKDPDLMHQALSFIQQHLRIPTGQAPATPDGPS